jgi:Flp pilus assembly protein CpaB
VELEYRDNSRRGKIVIVLGIILAIAAGAAAFYFVSQAQQQAGQAGLQKAALVVAVRTIPARKAIEAGDVVVREVPLDPTNAQGVVTDPKQVVGRVPAVTILEGQLVTTNLLASSVEGGQFQILRAEETVSPIRRPGGRSR